MNNILILDREEIKRRREEKGWSMGELARRSSLTVGAISHIESGRRKNLRLETMIKICGALEVQQSEPSA